MGSGECSDSGVYTGRDLDGMLPSKICFILEHSESQFGLFLIIRPNENKYEKFFV